jgi:Family of unknown function (DUF5752)
VPEAKAAASTSKRFEFCSRLNLTLLTGIRARDLAELVEHLRTVPGSVIYHHTHHYLVQHQHLSPEPPNDFAYWTSNVLLEERLGEELAAIDVMRFSTIRDLRNALVEVIQNYLDLTTNIRVAPPGQEFHFMRSVSFVLPTGLWASNLREFRDALEHVSLSAISYHMFDARLRLEQGDNDFAKWIESSIGDHDLANALRTLDPYTHTEEGLRRQIVRLVDRRLESGNGRAA